jgi:hypothetical protein
MLLTIIALAAAPAAANVQIPAQPELARVIAARDAELFGLAFGGCDPAKLRAMLTDDLEFYHDKAGLIYRKADDMVADYGQACERAKADSGYAKRRELVASSLHVDPVPGHGAMQTGEHLFYERQNGGPEKLTGRATFAHVWRLEGGSWKLARVLSYAHRTEGEK